MRRFLLLVSVLALSAGISRAQELPDPGAILSRAISQSKRCSFDGFQAKLDDNDKLVGWKPLTLKQRRMVEDLSLPMLFKFNPDRFDMGDYATRIEVGGRARLIVSFIPLPEAQQLKPNKSEGKNSVRVMNNLSGHVLIDEESGDIIEVKAELKGSYKFRWYIFPWTLESLSITMNHTLRGETWGPDKLDMTVDGTWIRFGSFFNQYRADFNCSPE
ncbi:MAG: hypothetical protein Q7R67_02345 [bacterium]|nr:hypothetical protein [bacterium]